MQNEKQNMHELTRKTETICARFGPNLNLDEFTDEFVCRWMLKSLRGKTSGGSRILDAPGAPANQQVCNESMGKFGGVLGVCRCSTCDKNSSTVGWINPPDCKEEISLTCTVLLEALRMFISAHGWRGCFIQPKQNGKGLVLTVPPWQKQ